MQIGHQADTQKGFRRSISSEKSISPDTGKAKGAVMEEGAARNRRHGV